MATATCATVAGVFSASASSKSAISFCNTANGVGSATGIVTWGGSSAKRSRVNWLPPATTPVLMDDGKTMAPVWYRAFQEVFQNRLGGIDAPTVPQVVTQSTQTQTQVLEVQSGIVAAGQQLSAVTDQVNQQTEVAQSSSLPGSDQLKKLPSYKQAQLNALGGE